MLKVTYIYIHTQRSWYATCVGPYRYIYIQYKCIHAAFLGFVRVTATDWPMHILKASSWEWSGALSRKRTIYLVKEPCYSYSRKQTQNISLVFNVQYWKNIYLWQKKEKKKKNNCIIHLLIFSYKRNIMQSIFVAFCSFYKPECVLIALLIWEITKIKTNKKKNMRGYLTWSHGRGDGDPFSFAELFSLCRDFPFCLIVCLFLKCVFLIILNNNIKNLFWKKNLWN